MLGLIEIPPWDDCQLLESWTVTMPSQDKRIGAPKFYFVDEAGDGTLFDKRGRVTVESKGCSRYFILGFADLARPDEVRRGLEELRATLLSDPYFRTVPSMRPDAGKTARLFHATDDVPEVRREVFRFLLAQDVKFQAVVRNKRSVLEYVRQRRDRDDSYRYHPNELYDSVVRRLFKNVLHKGDAYTICFAKRGKSDRTAALRAAIEAARRKFEVQWRVAGRAQVEVVAKNSRDDGGLQIADYLLWTLQRFYERNDDRYLNYIWPLCSLVHDVDDTRREQYGEYYNQRNPLSLAARK